MIKKFYFLFLFFVHAGIIYPANSGDLDFNIALKLYDNLEFHSALEKFERLAKTPQVSSTTELASLFYAKTLIRLERYEDAEKHLLNFSEKFLNSKYFDEARLTLAQVFFEQKDYLNSFKELINLAESTDEKFFKDYALESAKGIGELYLKPAELEILAITSSNQLKPMLQLLTGKAYLREKDYKKAGDIFSEVIRQNPDSKIIAEADKLYDTALSKNENRKESSLNSLIGVLLPLSSNQSAEAAAEILEGIKYAVSEFNKDRSDKIGLLIRDTELNSEKIELIKNELDGVQNLKAILGPVFSSEVRQALEVFKDKDIAIISPTATDDDLTGLYDNFFQANPSFTTRGRLMAQYLYYVENKRRMAVLNAVDGYSPVLASAFIDEFEKIGGRIITKETYKSSSFDLETPVNNFAANLADAEGIYLPLADKADAPVLLGQLVKSGINLPLYGNQDWIYAKGFESYPQLSNQLTFTSDFFIDYNSIDFQKFSSDYFHRTKKDANRNVLYGYDTAKYLLTVLRNFSGSSNAVKLKIESGLTSSGFHNNICFDEKRINKFLNIARYKDGRFELLDEFKMNN